MIEVKGTRVYVDGKETVDPELIGYAMLDAAEEGNIVITTVKKEQAKPAGFFACLKLFFAKRKAPETVVGRFEPAPEFKEEDNDDMLF